MHISLFDKSRCTQKNCYLSQVNSHSSYPRYHLGHCYLLRSSHYRRVCQSWQLITDCLLLSTWFIKLTSEHYSILTNHTNPTHTYNSCFTVHANYMITQVKGYSLSSIGWKHIISTCSHSVTASSLQSKPRFTVWPELADKFITLTGIEYGPYKQ